MHHVTIFLLLFLATPAGASDIPGVAVETPELRETAELSLVTSKTATDRKGPLLAYLDRLERYLADAADCPLDAERKAQIIARLKDKLARNHQRQDYLQRRLRAVQGEIAESDTFQRLAQALLKRLEELKSADEYEKGKPKRN